MNDAGAPCGGFTLTQAICAAGLFRVIGCGIGGGSDGRGVALAEAFALAVGLVVSPGPAACCRNAESSRPAKSAATATTTVASVNASDRASGEPERRFANCSNGGSSR